MRDDRHIEREVLAAVALFFALGFCEGRAQHGPLPAWNALAEESTAVVVGDVVEGQIEVIDPEKKAKAEVTPEGKPTLPNPGLFLIGMFSRVRVTEVIKGSAKIKAGGTVNVFIYGDIGSDRPHFLVKNEKCVLFLRPLGADDEQFGHATVVLPGTFAYPSRQPRFDPKEFYTPVEDGYAQVLVPPDKLDRIEKIKRAIAQPH
jgi:hypothetical protein